MSNLLGVVPGWTMNVPDNRWGYLALHLVSEHADPFAVRRGLRENEAQHAHEHDGPGTVRNHDRESRYFDLDRTRQAILEHLNEEYG